ncbi:MAG: GT4 family glycosyltransferase PelF [Candidatus Asgardarchaeia archaeon]
MKVCITAEGTYPITAGGVSYWIHSIIENNPDIDFYVVAIVPTDMTTSKFEKPDNLKKIIYIQVPKDVEKYTSTVKDKASKDIASKLIAFHELLRSYDFVTAAKLLSSIYVYIQKRKEKLWKLDEVWPFFEKEYTKRYREQPFFKYLTAWKNTHATLLAIMASEIPEADVYHATNSGFAGVAALLGSIIYNKPLMVTDHGIFIKELSMRLDNSDMPVLERVMLKRIGVTLSTFVYNTANLITTVCKYNKQWLVKHIGIPEKFVRVVYNGIDTNYFRPLLVPKEPNLVGTITRVYDLKNIKNFIKAAHLVLQEVPEAKFTVIGPIADQEYLDECNRLIDVLGISGKFNFMGPSTNPVFWYNVLSVFVLSSASEAFPLSTIEAMACGTPVVVTDVGGAAEAVDGAGFVVPPFDSKALAEKIIWLLKHPEEREKMGEYARKRAIEAFSKEIFIKQFHDIYLGLNNTMWIPIQKRVLLEYGMRTQAKSKR